MNADETEGFMEVRYGFPADQSKMLAGQTLPESVTKEYSIATKNPEGFAELKSQMQGIPMDSEIMMKRNYSYQAVSQPKLLQCIKNYVAMESTSLDALDIENEAMERVLKNIDTCKQFGVLNYAQGDVKAALDEALAKYEEEHGGKVEETLDTTRSMPMDVATPIGATSFISKVVTKSYI